jgi:hypothetical protein
MMLRARRLFLVLAAVWLVSALPAAAGVMASRVEEPASSRARNLAEVRDVLARDEVASALAAHGLSADEVESRLDRLSDEDLTSLAANVDQIQAAGDVPKYIWILLAVFLAVSILAIIL